VKHIGKRNIACFASSANPTGLIFLKAFYTFQNLYLQKDLRGEPFSSRRNINILDHCFAQFSDLLNSLVPKLLNVNFTAIHLLGVFEVVDPEYAYSKSSEWPPEAHCFAS
jgi:hypothetical protein